MPKRTTLVAGTVAAILLVAALAFRFNQSSLTRLTEEAPADVVSVNVEKSRHPNRRYYTDTHIAYRYIVSNKTLEGSFTKEGDHSSVFKSGARAKVCYNPSKPEESEVFTLDHQCGQ